jgi:peptidoglycan/LPS O-acetylase OafA/YrhL
MYLAFMRVGGFLRPVVQSVTKWGDFSYGVYLYGYPVQQMLMRTIGPKVPFGVFIGLSCLGTLLLAVLSWHFVEKPFLKLKKRTTRDVPSEGVPAAPVVTPAGSPDQPPHAARGPLIIQRQVSVLRQVIFFV